MEKEWYRYDLHVHTYEGSACGRSNAADLADFYKEKGYDGIVISDHFWRGNTRVDRDLPWNVWLDEFHKGYENAKARGDEIGLTVFYAWEYSFQGNDFLTFGLDNDWLLDYPDIGRIDLLEYLKLVREAGGFVIHAHPFYEAPYIPYIRLLPNHVDAVEVVNAPKGPFINARALEYATAYDLIQTGGSDCHSVNWKQLSGVEIPHPVATMQELIESLKKREHRVFLMEEEPVKNGDKPYKPGDFKLPPPPKDDKKQKLYW